MTNIVGDQNSRGPAKSQRKLWDLKSDNFAHSLNWTKNCVPEPVTDNLKSTQFNACTIMGV